MTEKLLFVNEDEHLCLCGHFFPIRNTWKNTDFLMTALILNIGSSTEAPLARHSGFWTKTRWLYFWKKVVRNLTIYGFLETFSGLFLREISTSL